MTQPRSSLAIALQDYKGLRPGIAITIAAVALAAAIVVGILHIFNLRQSRHAIEEGRSTIQTLHRYNAALEVWRQMTAAPEDIEFPEQARLRDSISLALQTQLRELQQSLTDTVDQELVGDVIQDLQAVGAEGAGGALGQRGREAMIVLTARQDSALFRAAARNQRSLYAAGVVIGLAVIAAGILILPMSWMYVRYKRGVPPGM
ncbi:MAG: hypothetical protein PVF27_00250 [Gemmatimonadales bacterium]|jgi:hypothetical protein